MTYKDLSSKHGKDERFKAVEKSRDREMYFNDFIVTARKKEKEERALKKEQDREDFQHLLEENVKDCGVKLVDLRRKLEHDSRWSAVNGEVREEIFRLFMRRMRNEAKMTEKQKIKERTDTRRKESEVSNENSLPSPGSVLPSPSTETEPINSDEEPEEGQMLTDEESEEEERLERERKERAQTSLREREREVQKSLATSLRDREKEARFHRHEEAVTEFQALLTDLIRNVELNWKDAKRTLKKDRRWKSVEGLTRDEMEDLYTAHCDIISHKKKQRFKDMMQEQNVDHSTIWTELRTRIKDDPRFTKFSTSERRCEREFELYIKDINSTMKVNFRELLKETKMLSWKTLDTLKTNPSYMKEIESHLELDKRYLQMKSIPEVRERVLMEFLEDLQAKGPPPPPTASEPTRRNKLLI